VGFHLKDTDHGWKARLKGLLALKAPAHIDVGILDTGEAEADGTSVLDVALWNEFGTATIPERSFIRAWFDEAEPALREDFTKLMQGVAAGKRTRAEVLDPNTEVAFPESVVSLFRGTGMVRRRCGDPSNDVVRFLRRRLAGGCQQPAQAKLPLIQVLGLGNAVRVQHERRPGRQDHAAGRAFRMLYQAEHHAGRDMVRRDRAIR